MYIASASSVVQFHDFPSGQLKYTYKPEHRIEGPCRSLSWSKDGNWLALVPYFGSAEVISLKGQCKPLHTIYNIAEPSCASFQSLSKKTITVGTKSGQVLLYDIKSRSVKARYPRVASAVTHVGFTAKDTHCYAGCASGEVLLFNSVAKNFTCSLKVPNSRSLTDVKAHPVKRNFLIGGSNEGIVCVWDVNVNKVKFHTDAHSAPVSSTIFSPVNATLIVSAGLDRVVRVFDIENQSRITTLTVENNIQSLDFLENSLYIVMGSQNGKILIYDTRSLQDPVYCFEAHKTAVKHIACTNGSGEASATTSESFIASEEVRTRPSNSNDEIQATKKRNSDFFGLVANEPSSVSEVYDVRPPVPSFEGGDSFIQALGLNENSPMSSFQEQNTQPDRARMSLGGVTPNPIKIIQGRLSIQDGGGNLPPTSTPKFPSGSLLNDASPISSGVKKVQIPAEISKEECQNAIKAFGEVELKNALEEIKEALDENKRALNEMETKMAYRIWDHGQVLRRMVLDSHMASLKGFMKLENYCDLIRGEVNTEPPSSRESYLLEENFNLKKRIEELESQVAEISARDTNGNE